MKILYELTNLKQTTPKSFISRHLKDELFEKINKVHNTYTREMDMYINERCTHFGVNYDEIQRITMQMLNAKLPKTKVRF